MKRHNSISYLRPCTASAALALAVLSALQWQCYAQEPSKTAEPASKTDTPTVDEQSFRESVQPFLKNHCFRCHNADKMKSGIRVDQLNATPEDKHIPLWKNIWKQVEDGAMPPDD